MKKGESMNRITEIVKSIEVETRKYHEKTKLLKELEIARKEDAFSFSLDFLTPAKTDIASGNFRSPIAHSIYFDTYEKTWDRNKDILLRAVEDILTQEVAYHKENVRKFLEELKEKQLNE